jgi:hypothetical protein
LLHHLGVDLLVVLQPLEVAKNAENLQQAGKARCKNGLMSLFIIAERFAVPRKCIV